jgi:glycosyltransferase involved in cell wall biosynthesis
MPLPLPSSALRAAREFRPDIVHAQSPFVSGLMARRLAQRLGSPLVFTHHTRFADYRHYLGPLAAPGAAVVSAYLRDFWLGCAAVVAPGQDLAREIAAQLGDRRRPVVRAIPTGIDLDAIRELAAVDPRPTHVGPADSVVAIALGRLAAEKSVDELIEAFARAAAGDARLRLLLIGGGPAEDAVRERVARDDLAGRAAVAGALPRPAALALLKGSDLFMSASRTETQGLVVAEALAAGLPVVAVDAPGVRDAVRPGRDGVLVTAAGDAAARVAGVASELASLATDAGRRAAWAAAAAQGAARFEVGVRIGEIVALYRWLLSGAG